MRGEVDVGRIDPGQVGPRLRTSAGTFSGGWNRPSVLLVPCRPIRTRPSAAWMTAYAPIIPPVARSSAGFWETTR